MKGDFMQNYFADQLQKQLDEDMQEAIEAEAEIRDRNGGHVPSTQKVRPAYEDGDIFEWKRHQQTLRTQHRKRMEAESDPKNRRGR